jgi:hypothetical protein
MSLTVSASGITFDDLTTLSTSVLSTANIADRTITSNKIAQGVSIVGSLSGTASIATTLATASATNAPVYGCRAWVNFDATRDFTGATNTNTTNRFIRSAGNVSSVLRVTSGEYNIIFTIPMSDTGYAIAGTSNQAVDGNRSSGWNIKNTDSSSLTLSSVRINTGSVSSGAAGDVTVNTVIVFGN